MTGPLLMRPTLWRFENPARMVRAWPLEPDARDQGRGMFELPRQDSFRWQWVRVVRDQLRL